MTVAPAVKKLAAELGVNIEEVSGTGANGAITQNDVYKSALASEQLKQPAEIRDDVQPTPEATQSGLKNPFAEAAAAFDNIAAERRAAMKEQRKLEESRRMATNPWDAAGRRWFVDKLDHPRSAEMDYKWETLDDARHLVHSGQYEYASAQRMGVTRLNDATMGHGDGSDAVVRQDLVLLQRPKQFAIDEEKVLTAKTIAQTATVRDKMIAMGLEEKAGKFGRRKKTVKTVGRDSATPGDFFQSGAES